MHCQNEEHSLLSASCGDVINSVFSRISHLVPLAFLLLSGAVNQYSPRDLCVLAKMQNVHEEYPCCPFSPLELKAGEQKCKFKSVFLTGLFIPWSVICGAVLEEPQEIEAAGEAVVVLSPGLVAAACLCLCQGAGCMGFSGFSLPWC